MQQQNKFSSHTRVFFWQVQDKSKCVKAFLEIIIIKSFFYCNHVLKLKFKALLPFWTRDKYVSTAQGWNRLTSSDLLQQVGREEAKLASCADLQVAIHLLTFLHDNLRTHITETQSVIFFLCTCRLCVPWCPTTRRAIVNIIPVAGEQ